MSLYDGLADEYAKFLDAHAPYYELAEQLLRRLLGRGPGRCVDLGCGTGLTNAEIAAALVVSGATIKTHVNHIFAKTGARDRAQAVRYAYQHGIA